MIHKVSSAIVEEEIPSGINASCGEEDKGNLGCINEGRHHYKDSGTNDGMIKTSQSTDQTEVYLTIE